MAKKGRKSTADMLEEAFVCCENYDFLWDKKDLPVVREMWKEGQSIIDIAKVFERKPQEVLFLIIDQYDAQKIKRRPNGIWGKED